MTAFSTTPPTFIPVSKSLPVRLLRARESVMSRLRPILRSHGLTEQQWRVLRTLYEFKELEVTILGEQVFLLPPSLSRILRDLEARKIILRRSSPSDQRRALVSLSPAGEALLVEVAPAMFDEGEVIRDLYGRERVAQLFDLLDQLEDALGRPVGGRDEA
jgi:homoprotocatechuate degradation regulator HpaR